MDPSASGRKSSQPMTRLSSAFKIAVRTSATRQGRLAAAVKVAPAVLSRRLNDLERTRLGDPRFVALGRLLGLEPERVFESEAE